MDGRCDQVAQEYLDGGLLIFDSGGAGADSKPANVDLGPVFNCAQVSPISV